MRELGRFVIETERLILLPMTRAFILDKLSEIETEFEKRGVLIEEKDFRSSELRDALPFLLDYDDYFFSSGYGPWLIMNQDYNVIGNCGCHDLPTKADEVEIGYEIYEKYRQMGYGFEAVEAYVNWLIHEKKMGTIKADCKSDNIGSIKILQKIKMKEIKRDDQYVYFQLQLNHRNGE